MINAEIGKESEILNQLKKKTFSAARTLVI
jgi:hypothetical protein